MFGVQGAIEYAYDNLSRLTEARYNPGTNLETSEGDLLRRYLYSFDLAGCAGRRSLWHRRTISDLLRDQMPDQSHDEHSYPHQPDLHLHPEGQE